MRRAWIGLALAAFGMVGKAPGQDPAPAGPSALGKLMTHPSFLTQGDPRINPYAANRDDPWFRAWLWNQHMDQTYRSPLKDIEGRRAQQKASREVRPVQALPKKQVFDRTPAYQSDRLTRYYGRHQAILSPTRDSRGVPTEGRAVKRR